METQEASSPKGGEAGDNGGRMGRMGDMGGMARRRCMLVEIRGTHSKGFSTLLLSMISQQQLTDVDVTFCSLYGCKKAGKGGDVTKHTGEVRSQTLY